MSDPKLQRTLDELLASVRSTQRQVENIDSWVGEVVPWYDSDVERFRDGSNADVIDELLTLKRSLRSVERIARVWGAQ